MTERPRCYIAGPMRNRPKSNFPAFDNAAKILELHGFIPINPAELDRAHEGWGDAPPPGYTPSFDNLRRFIRRDLLAIMELDDERGDAIYLLPGWEESKGARAEKALAEFLNLKILHGV